MDDKLLKFMIKPSISKLLDQITKDYQDIYHFSRQDLENYVDQFQINFQTVKIKTRKKAKRKPVSTKSQCQARVWGDGHMRLQKLKHNDEITADIFGRQCKKRASSDDVYCHNHIDNLPHGNYFCIPSRKIRGFYYHKNHVRP